MKKFIIATALLMVYLFTPAYSSETVRYLLAVGANHGGDQREVLRFAVSDAQSFAGIMTQMGGISRDRTTVLVDPDPEQFKSEFERISRKLSEERRKSKRTELLFYYSGHSDETGLLLGNNTMQYRDLRSLIQQLPSDVKIAILDSCSSGAFTRVKGGKMVTPFMSDSSQDMRGFAFMTSSSADEVSQESDRIGGSFFTHYLISGLRGAADGRHDGRITLNEAYQYAYRETLSRTERTAGGAQHPNYHIQMTGTGDVILTDIRAGDAFLVLGDSLDGRFFINSGSSVSAEVTKQKGDSLTIALTEGKYSIVRDTEGLMYETHCTLKKNSRFEASESFFTPVKKEISTPRGGDEDPVQSYIIKPFGAFFMPSASSGDGKVVNNVQLYLFGSRSTQVKGVSLGIGVGMADEDLDGVAISCIGTIAGRDASSMQASGIFCYTGHDFKGLQAAGVFTHTGNDFHGLQAAGVFSDTGCSFTGLQASGILNTARGSFKGFQTAGIANFTAGDFKGFQAASAVNYTMGNFHGMQAAPVNLSTADFTGFQAGVVNVTNVFSGCQLGVVNIANRFDSGVQLGIVNYSTDNDGYPIGLVSIVRNGETRGDLFMEENGFLRATLSHGGKKFYMIYTGGYLTDGRGASGGFGFGKRFIFGNLYCSIEGVTQNIYMNGHPGNELYLENQLKITTGYSLFSRFACFAGISINHYYHNRPDDRSVSPGLSVWKNRKNIIAPGVFAGIRF